MAELQLKEEIEAQAGTRKEVEELQEDYNGLVKDTKVSHSTGSFLRSRWGFARVRVDADHSLAPPASSLFLSNPSTPDRRLVLSSIFPLASPTISSLRAHLHPSPRQEVEKATNEITKQLQTFDRADVQLQEKKKSTLAKIKKLKKSLQEDSHARSEAETWVRNHAETIERVGAEVERMDQQLEKDEAELEKVRDGLKGE